MITFIESFKRELAGEKIATRKMLALVPNDKADWAPHAKSMKMNTLANHLASMSLMIAIAVKFDKWDFANSPYPSVTCNNTQEIVDYYDYCVAEAEAALETATDDNLQNRWTMCMGDQVWLDLEKWEAVRHAFGQNSHHRAQLGVYLRLLDIPIPGCYGPSADEMGG